jgi:UDP-N-acetylglucosamine diphosphorylase/glucosamine-1-phosphate N-acetyltransferase
MSQSIAVNLDASAAPSAILLAAGKGTRMKSDLPKVLHPIGGRPMLCAVVDACREAGCKRIVLVVGYKQELVREAMAAQGAAWSAGLEYAVQDQQLGTGHAVRCAEELFRKDIAATGKRSVFVLAGDGPLIRGKTLSELLNRHVSTGAAATLATSVIDDPTGYGRIVRNAAGMFTEIVEDKQCTPAQLAIREVNPSYYCFDTRELFTTLALVPKNPASGEYYITGVHPMLLSQGKRVEVIAAVPPQDVLSINTLEQLAEVDAIYRGRHAGSGMLANQSGAAR